MFVLPGMAVMLGFSILYATLRKVPVVSALFFGLKCAVLVLAVEALLRVARWAAQDERGLDARRIIYTTISIEAVNAKLRRAVRARGHFPNDEAVQKLLFLVLCVPSPSRSAIGCMLVRSPGPISPAM